MAEQSFPIVEQPLSAEQWKSVTLGIGNGILDEGGFPYRLNSFSNTTNTGVLRPSNVTGVAAAIVNGFYHRIDATMTLAFPPVASRTTYYVVLQYDPLSATMPVSVQVVTSLDTTQGKNYLHLYNVTRNANELLTDAAVRMVRPRVSPVQMYASEGDLPAANKTLWGTIAIVHNGRSSNNAKIMMSITGDDGETTTGWFWKTVYDPNGNAFEWSSIADTGTYGNPGSGYTRALGRRGKERRLRGRVSLNSGNKFGPGVTYNILSGSINISDAPSATERFLCAISGSPTSGSRIAQIEVTPSGDVTALVSASATFIDLAGCWWEVA